MYRLKVFGIVLAYPLLYVGILAVSAQDVCDQRILRGLEEFQARCRLQWSLDDFAAREKARNRPEAPRQGNVEENATPQPPPAVAPQQPPPDVGQSREGQQAEEYRSDEERGICIEDSFSQPMAMNGIFTAVQGANINRRKS